jgi:hypothetical protein
LEAKRFVRLCLLAVCLITVGCGETNGGRGDGEEKDAGASGGDTNNNGGNSNGGNTSSPDAGGPGGGEDSGSDAEMPPIDARRQKVVSVGPPYGVAGEAYGYSPKSDQAGEASWSVKQGPAGMSVDEKSQRVAWIPTEKQGGKHEVEIEGATGDKAVTQTYEMYVAVSEKQAEATVNPKAESVIAVSSPKSDLQGTAVYTAPGAVKEPVAISISKVDQAPPMREAKGEITAVQFGPSGTVFQQPALVALPLSSEGDIAPDLARVGAFVYNPEGRWERVPIVRVDLANRLVYARANHFSTLAAAESAFALDASLAVMPASSACEGELVGRASLVGALSDVSAEVVNNLPAELRAIVRSGVSALPKLLTQAQLEGSFRFSRVLTLWSGPATARVKVDEQLLVTTLYLPGDGTAQISHDDALGNEVASFAFSSLVDSFADIEAHLRGAHTHALFRSAPTGALSLSAHMHVAFYEGDATADAASADDLGLALVDAPAGDPAQPAAAGDLDSDCDSVNNAVDNLDNRLLPRFEASPRTVVSSVVGSPVRLSVTLHNAPENPQVTFDVLAGAASLASVDGEPNARDLVALKPGRYLVEARASAAGGNVSHVFAVDILPAAAVPACSLTASSGHVKVGEKITLSAAVEGSSSALSFEWGTVSEGTTFSSFAGPDAANTTLFAPQTPGTLTLGCRASDGVTTGATGLLTLDVLSADQNRAPLDLLLSPPATTIVVGQSVALVAFASDPDGDALTFTWSAQAGTLGTATPATSSSTNTFQAAAAGFYEIKVSVEDGKAPAALLHANVLVVSDRTVLDAADNDGDGWPAGSGLDCNDANAKVYPGAFDACGDEVDDDCDGTARQSDCDADGVTAQQGDCNDGNALIKPGAFEYCDGIDNDCDEAVDERELQPVGGTCSRGAGACQTAGVYVCASDALNTVCNAPSVAPTAELCNGLDDNCDGITSLEETDNDGDGLAECAGDCDDTRENVRAGLSDLCDSVDNDCDGKKDEDHQAEPTTCGVGVCASSGAMACVNGQAADSCMVKQATGVDDDCDGADDDCDGKTDEAFAMQVTCGKGVCQMNGEATCSNGKVTSSCTPGQGAPNDAACNGDDDDCDGETDEDAVSFPYDVCNGVDDDCNGEIDPISCEGGVADPNCVESTETCNMLDDDCDGATDDGNVCGIALSPGSLLGAWWRCTDATCTQYTTFGLLFTSIVGMPDTFQAFSLSTLDQEPYQPNHDPYCGEAYLAYTHNQATGELTVFSQEDDELEMAAGNVTFSGQRATIHWTTPPPDDSADFELIRVPEHAAGRCGGHECSAIENCENQIDDNCDGEVNNGCPGVCTGEVCNNGIDDDCDKAIDSQDSDCGGSCVPSGSSQEQCNGKDDNCNGQIDELNGPCSVPNQFGACAMGQMFCGQNGAEPFCQQRTQPGIEYCDDHRDTDCDGIGETDGLGQENDEPACQTLPAGEACFNAIDISNVGTVSMSFANALKNEHDGCGQLNQADRVYRFTIPGSGGGLGLSSQAFFHLKMAQVVGATPVSAAIFKDSCQGDRPQCFDSLKGDFTTQLSPGNYFIVLRGPSDALGVTLSVGYQSGGCEGDCACSPEDLDGDDSTICNGDCNEDNSAIGRYAEETCNGLDDDCNGQTDDLSSETCGAEGLGVCALGRLSCTSNGEECAPVYAGGVEYCNDDVDSDCDGDDSRGEADCDTSDTAAETCFGATFIGAGGTYAGTLQFANDDLALPTCTASDGVEHVYAFDVPTGYDYREVTVRRVHGTGRLDFSILSSCESLTVESCLRASGSASLANSGTHYLVVEGDPGDYAFTLGISGDRECLTPDSDGDGYTACDADCDETDETINRDGAEGITCDGTDNDCDGQIDNLHAGCDVQALLGECRKGLLSCPSGCQQQTYPQDSVEVCNDGIDNDCDGEGDDQGQTGVDCQLAGIPGGETCGLAIDTKGGGHFEGSLQGALDNVELDCNAPNLPDQFFRIDLLERRRLWTRASIHPESLPGGTQPAMLTIAVLDESCARAGQLACMRSEDNRVLDPGTYFLVVEGPGGITFGLDVWSQLEEGGNPETCIPGDLDEDGQTACDGDCGEGNPDIYGPRTFCNQGKECETIPGAREECDGLDNDCSGGVDDIEATECTVEGAFGVCASGMISCQSGTSTCVAHVTPGLERCGDGKDTDCDGEGQTLPEAESDCSPPPPGDMCSNAINISGGGFRESSLNGMSPDGFSCLQGPVPDRYFVFTAPQSGFLFVDVKPIGTQDVTIYTQISDSCQGSGGCYYGGVSQYAVTANKPVYVSVGASSPVSFQLRAAFGTPVGESWNCNANGVEGADFDADGSSLCDLDCDENNPNVHPDQLELCNGIDDDCAGGIDDVQGECTVAGLEGECAKGQAFGCDGTQIKCGQTVGPDLEFCSDGLDTDCDGDAGFSEGGCVSPQ